LCVALAAILVGVALLAAQPGFAQDKPTEIDAAFSRMYNFDFPGAQALLNRHIAADPGDPLSYAVRSSAYLFSELDRLSILEGEFFTNDKRIADHKKLQPDPNTRTQLFQAVNDAQSRAEARLASNPDDQEALFSFCITTGVLTDYTALVEKRQIGSLSLVKRAALYAQRLLKVNPKYYDAYLTTGMTEYVIGSLPFFVRWFVKIDNLNPSKEEGMKTVELVANQGHYLKPFAKILLAVANLREKKPTEAQKIMVDLTREYPENPLFRKELAQLSAKLQSGQLRDGQ
jgi:hypothetical protein